LVIGNKGIKAKFKNFWDLFMMVIIIYVSAVTTYRVAFSVEK